MCPVDLPLDFNTVPSSFSSSSLSSPFFNDCALKRSNTGTRHHFHFDMILYIGMIERQFFTIKPSFETMFIK